MRIRIHEPAFAALAVPAQQVPQQLQPPATEQLLLQVHAKGDQIYTCAGDPAQFAWTLERPDAQLIDKDGKSFGKHFAGPSWKAQDGSRVTGKGVAHAPSPDADSIPWLLVNIVGHEGAGVLSRATTIQRLNTKGGQASALPIPPTTFSTPRNNPQPGAPALRGMPAHALS